MIYNNPIILSDYSDPDCIRVNDNYYMISSSFNHVPGVPVLKSKNLVDWKLIGHVFQELPFKRFDNVVHGCGAWAPSIRYHNNKFYAIIPFPDEGIYVSECTDIEKGDWSPLWPLIEGCGLEDPCPIWHDDKCYLVIGFVKSRIGFNSVLGLYEVSTDLKKCYSDTYTIIYDGHNTQPTIEGPKFYYKDDYFYILAPAGSVKTGWQTALRSKNVYGPYEEKIIMCQNDSSINGPHQGALIDLGFDKWAFIHFQDRGAYGRIVHLEPVTWANGWPLCGMVKDELLCGTPVDSHEYLVNIESDYKIDISDNFKNNKLSLMWQTPANKKDNFYSFENGLRLNCIYHNEDSFKALNLAPNVFLTKISSECFKVSTKLKLSLINEDDESGLTFMGYKYGTILIRLINNEKHLLILSGAYNEIDKIIYDEIINDDEVTLNMYFKDLVYQFGFNNKKIGPKFIAERGRWIGGKYGVYSRGNKNSNGYSIFKNFKVINYAK